VGIVGGGLAGLAAACTLAARGYAVTVFEKSAWLGGKAAVLEEQGYRFDMGPTILTLPSVLRRICDEAGRKLEDFLELIPLDPQWRCFFSDGSTLDLVTDVAQMQKGLEAYSPATRSAQGYRDFLDFSARLHSISERFFFWRSIGSLWDMLDLRTMFQPGMLLDVLSMRLGKSVAQCVRSHVPDARVAQMLDHFTQYVGSAPDASPAVLCGIAHMQTQEGVWYPRGGIGAVPKALVELGTQLGVDFRTSVGVRRILLDESNGVAGLETERGEKHSFAAVISNCDSVRTHRELLQGTKAARRFEARRRYEPACSGVVLYLGLEQAYDHLLHHNFVFSKDPEAEFEDIYRRGEPAGDPTCYVAAPARSEPGVAPPGGEALYVLAHTPYLRRHHDWTKILPAYRETILAKLADTGGMKDLEKRIRFERCLTPKDIHERYHVLNGAIYGLASHGKMFGAFKPANRSRDVKGLYLAGGAAHPGPGMPMVLMSGWIAASTLDQDGVARPKKGSGVVSYDEKTPDPFSIPTALTRRSPWLVRLFTRYCRRYLRKSFHAVRLAHATRPVDPGEQPLIVVLNHPSWWDPLLCLLLTELFPGRQHYGPIDAKALGKYRFFERLGFFGVDQSSRQGAMDFLRQGRAVLAQPGGALWITAQGRFTDARIRPLDLRPGVGHLVRGLQGGVILPLALEYPFWEERYPEALARFGEPIAIGEGSALSVAEWMQRIEEGLTAAQDALSQDALAGNAEAFETLLGGTAGVGGIYDLWRRLRAWMRGEPFQAAHGSVDSLTLVDRTDRQTVPSGTGR
jgi:phytoene desaturase